MVSARIPAHAGATNNSRRILLVRKVLIGLTTVVSATCFGLLPVSAAPLPAARTVEIIGGERFSPDEFFEITYHFATRRIAVHQGDTVT